MENDNLVGEYLERIELNHPTNGPNQEYLNQLHIGHLTHIPFETFDLIDLKELKISLDCIFNRLIRENRGGVCFQMNGLFTFILKSLNYNVQLIPCNVYDEEINNYNNVYDHLASCITLDNDVKVLCDVGFSKDFLAPLFLQTDCIQYATNGFFRLTKTDDGLYYKLERGFLINDKNISLPSSSIPQTHIIDINPDDIKWAISYRFPIDFAERKTKLEDFKDASLYIVHSPDVSLNHCSICHIHTYKPFIGAYGIVGKEYWEWILENGTKTRKHYPILDNDKELKSILKEKFNLTIDRDLKLVGGST